MSRKRQLTDEERALWRGFVRSITPLREQPPHSAPAADIAADAKPAAPLAPAAPAEKVPARRRPPANIAPPLASLDRRLKQRVARGRQPIDARLDLHGMTQQQAHARLLQFLHAAQADGATIALVVTGKGGDKGPAARVSDATRGSGILKRQVPLWFALPEFRAVVLSFESAHPGHGGEGALYVRLRRAR